MVVRLNVLTLQSIIFYSDALRTISFTFKHADLDRPNAKSMRSWLPSVAHEYFQTRIFVRLVLQFIFSSSFFYLSSCGRTVITSERKILAVSLKYRQRDYVFPSYSRKRHDASLELIDRFEVQHYVLDFRLLASKIDEKIL